MDVDIPARVDEVMSTPLRTVSSKATVVEAARAMREHDISALVVTTGPPSIITSTDIIDAVATDGDVSELLVRDVMTESVETVPPDLGLQEAAAMMTSLGIKHLPVVDDDYVGIISSTDLTAYVA